MHQLKLFLLFCTSFLFLTACGGSGSSKSSNTDDDSQTIESSTINGIINTAANTDFDSDLNDINTPFIDNSSFTNAQTLNNFVVLQGFVNRANTSTFATSSSDRSNDRFKNTTDLDDIYQVQLQAGQRIQLQVVNFLPTSESGDIFSGDIDLELYSATYKLLGRSDTSSEFEYLEAPTDGIYYIRVTAYSGASKYILQLLPAATQTTSTQINTGTESMNFEANQLIVQYKDSATFSAANTNTQALHTGISRPTLVTINEATSFNISTNSASALNELANLNPSSYQKLQTLITLKKLKQQENVIDATLNYIREKQKTPNDTYYEYQWHYQSMHLPQAWDITTGTPTSGSIIVAVIDTGIYSAHPDLKNKIISGYDFILNDQNSLDNEPGIDNNPEDPGDAQELGSSSWHGTHVAGTVGAQSNNNLGVAGVSWGAKIMPLRVLGQSGGTSYDIMQAVRFAAGLENDSGTIPAQRADIINLSLGGTGSSTLEASLYKQVHDLGIMIVASAGNDNTSTPSYPASYDGVISVSATDFSQTKAPYSNSGNYIDIAAPGGNIAINLSGDDQPDGVLSTLVDDSSGQKKAIFSFYQGTSMAAPHVSGMLALMKAVYPSLTASMVDDLLIDGSLTDDAGESGRDNIYGYGNANALKAVQTALSLENGGSLPPSPPILLISPSSLSFSNTTQAIITISNEGGGEPMVLSAFSNNHWLNISPLNVDTNGIGTYQVTIDDTNLSTGFYLGSVIFTFDNAPSSSILVSLNVGDIESNGKLANLYTLLYDIDRDEVIQESHGINNNTESIKFRFYQVPKGRYKIISGTDVDNDGFICQLGEACAIYPQSSQIDPIDNSDLKTIDVEMTATILSSLNSISQQSENNDFISTGIARPNITLAPTSIEKRVSK